MPFVTKQQVSAGCVHCVLLQDGTVGTCDVIKMYSYFPCENVEVKIYRTTILLVVLFACETSSLITGGTQAEGVWM
jgi:hypothetical protein